MSRASTVTFVRLVLLPMAFHVWSPAHSLIVMVYWALFDCSFFYPDNVALLNPFFAPLSIYPFQK
jgi:hypothetical protein